MKLKNFIAVLAISFIFGKSYTQSINKTFQGGWARTTWTYSFHSDKTYLFTTSGHFGNVEQKGTYQLSGDTVFIKTSTDPQYFIGSYLLYGDSFLIDLEQFYDYRLMTDYNFYNSKKRYDILPNPNMDSTVTISKTFFDINVKEATEALKNKAHSLSDNQHIKIIRCYNTIQFDRNHYIDPLYKDFLTEINTSNYIKEMSTYYDWIPNRGMGFYFQKLQIELGGTPHFFSRYTVIK